MLTNCKSFLPQNIVQNSRFYGTLKHVIFLLRLMQDFYVVLFYYRVINQMKIYGSYEIFPRATAKANIEHFPLTGDEKTLRGKMEESL